MTKLTALEVLADRSNLASDNARIHEKNTFMRGYREGQASAYNSASITMQCELERLRNLFQNGMLNYDSFDLPA